MLIHKAIPTQFFKNGCIGFQIFLGAILTEEKDLLASGNCSTIKLHKLFSHILYFYLCSIQIMPLLFLSYVIIFRNFFMGLRRLLAVFHLHSSNWHFRNLDNPFTSLKLNERRNGSASFYYHICCRYDCHLATLFSECRLFL